MKPLRSGDMYLFPLSSDMYAATPFRLWWAPWRWALTVYWYRQLSGPYFDTVDEVVATNISKSEVIGLIKLIGYPHELRG